MHKQLHMGMHTYSALFLSCTHSEYTHTLSTLEAWGCDLSKGFLLWLVCQTVWRAVEGPASPRLPDEKACNICFLWHSTRPPLSSVPPLPASVSRLPSHFSWGGLPAETGRLIRPCSPPPLYPSDKALCISFFCRLLVSHSDCPAEKIRVKPFYFICCGLFDVSDLALVLVYL